MPTVEITNDTVEITNDDVEDAFCRAIVRLTGIARVLPREDCNKYGIDVLRNKKDPYLLQFHWVTKDMLEINLEFDLIYLRDQGKQYIDSRKELILAQLDKARQVRQEENSIVINDVAQPQPEDPKPAPELKPTTPEQKLANAIDRTLH